MRAIRQRFIQILILLAAAIAPALAFAETQPASLDDRAALEAWTDGTVNALLQANHCAGGVVAIVHNGEVVLAKGYGYADIENRIPVDPAKTLFRIGSVSKLFVWTSVMQLFEQGKIDLNADVSTYVDDVRVPKRYGQPITMKDLMTHTSGFEDQVLGLFSHDPAKMRPLVDILRDEMPARVREPGHFASYSNHGTALAMHAVERIYGAPWQKYIQSNIIDPIGLKHTVLAQPLPAEFAGDVSKGYAWRGNTFVEQPFELVPLGEIGGVSTTATDMATFMQMFLNLGEHNGTHILRKETAQLMQTPLHTMAPGANPQAYGMLDMSTPGLHIVGHDGDTIWFHTSLSLLPEHNTGVFVSFNSNTGAAARSEFIEAFARHFFVPNDPEKPQSPAGFGAHAAKYTGSYRFNRFSHRSLAKVAYALSPVEVTYDTKGALNLSLTGNERWIEVAPNTFQEEYGRNRIIFIANDNGQVDHFVFANNGVMAMERNGWIDEPATHALAFGCVILICLLSVIAWPIGALMRWKHDVIKSRGDLISVPARVLGWISCVLVLAFTVMFINAAGDPDQLAFGVPQSFAVLLSLPILVALLAIGMIGITVRQWTRGQGTFFARIAYTTVTLALCVFVFQAIFWNLTIAQNYQFL